MVEKLIENLTEPPKKTSPLCSEARVNMERDGRFRLALQGFKGTPSLWQDPNWMAGASARGITSLVARLPQHMVANSFSGASPCAKHNAGSTAVCELWRCQQPHLLCAKHLRVQKQRGHTPRGETTTEDVGALKPGLCEYVCEFEDSRGHCMRVK